MPEELFKKLIGAKRVHDVSAWLHLGADGVTPYLRGLIRHIKDGPAHEHVFLHTKKGWVKC